MFIHRPFLHNNPLFSSIERSEKVLFRLNKSRRNSSNNNININNNGVEKESDFETDKDKAREALRKLDEQLLSLSTKQVTTPKIRAVELRQSSLKEEEELLEISGSFWAYAISFLFLFTIVYNIVFVTIIKPSIDGQEPIESREIVIKLDDKEGSP